MQVLYTEKEYREMAKEVCFLTNDLKQITDMICQEELYKDVNTQSSATVRGIQLVDQLKNYLVQMNFLTCNVAESMMGRSDTIELFDRAVDNTNNDSDNIGDSVELYNPNEGNEEVLDNS